MKITSVNLKKIFPGQIQFTNTTVGMEASVDEGEDPSDVLENKGNTLKYCLWMMI